MKYDCDLIKDIMPLYMDGVLSEKSKKIISEHLLECTECNQFYLSYSSKEFDIKIIENPEENQKVKHYSKRIKTNRILISVSIILIFLLLLSSFVSYVKFNTVNPFAVGYGLVKVTITDSSYVEVQRNPRVIIADSDHAWQLFLDTIKKEGYTYIEEEQLGSLVCIEKDGKRERVLFSMNRYFSKWIWKE